MKKYVLLISYLLSITPAVLAQYELGIKIAPGSSYSRLYTNPPDTMHFTSGRFSFNMNLGLLFDYCIKDNYYASTGLLLSNRKFSLCNGNISSKLKEIHTLRYLQVPLLFKLYTGEVALDTRIYVAIGPVGAIKIHERISQLASKTSFIKKIKLWDLRGLLGIGIEYNLSLFTRVFAGLSYDFGLHSIIAEQDNSPNTSLLEGYSDGISVEIGLKL